MLDYQVKNMYENEFDGYDMDEVEFRHECGNNMNPFTEIEKKDKGLNIITKNIVLNNGKIKKKRIKVYASNGTGNQIRDAESGEYYDNKVGSKDEYLFFKVAFATGQFNSANNSNTLFYTTPEQYENHMYITVDKERYAEWYERRQDRLNELAKTSKPRCNTTIVK